MTNLRPMRPKQYTVRFTKPALVFLAAMFVMLASLTMIVIYWAFKEVCQLCLAA